ncbi:hypothetical protein J4558_27735 [Leptolyngbya sp. 15MV]|nr:hypothetical protein J4558_27735 [Leptolyngbya sp. 15MV]
MTHRASSKPPAWRYWALLAAQTTGGAIIICQVVPIYKRFLIGEPADPASRTVYLCAALAVALVHSSYWLTFNHTPPVGHRHRPLLGHLVQFTGRAAFIFAAGMFAAVFYLRFGQLGLDWWRYAIILIVLFSMFCVSRSLGSRRSRRG